MLDRMKPFFIVRSHLLTFVGAFIVFLTFVVKEGLGERWKQTADAIDMAQYMYSIQADTSGETQRYWDLNTGLVEIRRVILAHGDETEQKQAKQLKVQTDDMRKFSRWMDAYLVNLKTLGILIGHLPSSKTYKEQVSELQNRAKYVHERLNMAYGDRHWKEVEEPAMNDLNRWEADIEKLSRSILSDAETLRRRNSLLSARAWWISTFLFALGWGLGLLGKLYGVPGTASGE
ncbi:MAG TPA: hypothetical protein VNX26_16880 [Candidatus Acidoferrum sp.]|nr:hypothetical protein [Candidatus Acidoferrum sp.]